jgi:hypothetical protein
MAAILNYVALASLVFWIAASRLSSFPLGSASFFSISRESR